MSYEIRQTGLTTSVLGGKITTTCDECKTSEGPFLACVLACTDHNAESVICRACFLAQDSVSEFTGRTVELVELEALIRTFVAMVDRDGGQKQQYETPIESFRRAAYFLSDEKAAREEYDRVVRRLTRAQLAAIRRRYRAGAIDLLQARADVHVLLSVIDALQLQLILTGADVHRQRAIDFGTSGQS